MSMNFKLKQPRQISVGWTIAFAMMLSVLMFIVTQLFVVPPCGRIISAAECPVGDTVTFNDTIGIKGGSNFTITLAASSTPTQNSTVRIPANEDGLLLTSGSDIPLSSLATGTARQLLQMNSGGSSAEWTSGISLATITASTTASSTAVDISQGDLLVQDTLFLFDRGNEFIDSTGSTMRIGSGSAIYELPAADGTADQVLKTDGSGNLDWTTIAAGGSPGGSTGQVQFNSSGSFAGDADLFWDNSSKELGIGTNTPDSELDVEGTVRITGSGSGSTYAMTITNSNTEVKFAAADATSVTKSISFFESSVASTTSERLRIDNNVYINTAGVTSPGQGSLIIGCTEGTSCVGSSSQWPIPMNTNAAAFLSDIIGGVTEMWVIDGAGNNSVISPHPAAELDHVSMDCELPWGFLSSNSYLGKQVYVNWCDFIRAVELITGQQFMYVTEIKDRPKLDWDQVQNYYYEQCVNLYHQNQQSNNSGLNAAENEKLLTATNCKREPPPSYLAKRGVQSSILATKSDESEE
tara:strand:- start:472 stop:2040 length:1569 start_codon:yes stop_codon:yes gene_type:complete